MLNCKANVRIENCHFSDILIRKFVGFFQVSAGIVFPFLGGLKKKKSGCKSLFCFKRLLYVCNMVKGGYFQAMPQI